MVAKAKHFKYSNEVVDFLNELKDRAERIGLAPKVISVTGEQGDYMVFYWEL